MRSVVTGTQLVLCLALVSAGQAFTQTPSEESTIEAAAAAPVAYVYVQTSKGINFYDAAGNGKLTLVSGSPFKTTGTMVGSNGKFFITLGAEFIDSYTVASNGAIGGQVSTIDPQHFAGGHCGSTTGAVLDHTGQDLYVGIFNGIVQSSLSCSEVQSFTIAKGSGALSFISVADEDDNSDIPAPTLSSTNIFGYSVDLPQGPDAVPYLIGFKRAANGGLVAWAFHETDPEPQPGGWIYIPWLAQATPGNFLAASIFPEQDAPDGVPGPFQLASYTIDSKGDLTSTNTWKNMPTPTVCPTSLYMSPAGNLLAVAGNKAGCGDDLPGSAGLQLFHFHGASPITTFGKALTTVPISQIRWDTSNHLYALSDSTHKLFVYTITPTSIVEAPGSPYTIASASSLVVISK
jgi:hypothetical protein